MEKIFGYMELKPNAFELRDSINVVQCIALRDIDCFGTYKELTSEEYEIAYKEGFVLNGIDEDGRCLYVRENVLI